MQAKSATRTIRQVKKVMQIPQQASGIPLLSKVDKGQVRAGYTHKALLVEGSDYMSRPMHNSDFSDCSVRKIEPLAPNELQAKGSD